MSDLKHRRVGTVVRRGRIAYTHGGGVRKRKTQIENKKQKTGSRTRLSYQSARAVGHKKLYYNNNEKTLGTSPPP